MAFVDVTDPAKPEGSPSGFVDVTDPTYKPRSAIGEIATGLKRGAMVDLPQMTGQALQYVTSPGGTINDFGKGIAESAEARGARADLTMHPEEHGVVANALASGAEMVPSIAAPALIGAGALAALPAMPALAGTAVVAGIAAAPFAAQAGQSTLDKAEKAGVPEDAAHTAARLNAGLTFATQMGLGMVGGKMLGAGGRLFGSVVREDGAELAAQTLADISGKGALLKPFAKDAVVGAGEAVVAGGAQAAGSAAIEKAYGVDTKDPWEAAIEQAPAMLGLSAILAPMGLAARAVRANALNKRAEALASKDTAPEIRDQLATQYFTELNKVDPEAAKHFAINADTAIKSGLPLELDKGLFQQGAVQAPAAAAPPAEQGMRALPAPPSFPALPRSVLPGEIPGDVGPHEADFRAAEVQRGRDAEDNRRALVDTHAQIVAELTAAGVEPTRSLSFGDFRTAMGEEAKKSGLKPSDLTEGDYRDMWEKHQRDVMTDNVRKAQDHAFSLAENNKPETGATGAPAKKTALGNALEDAIKRKQVDDAHRQYQREQAAAKDRELARIQHETRGAAIAAAAERGESPKGGTLPAATDRLVRALHEAKPEGQAMPPKVVKEVSGAVSGKKTLEAQLTALKALRDGKNPKTATFEILDRMYQKLGGDDALQERSAEGVDVRKPPGDGKAVAEGHAAGSEAAAQSGRAGNGEAAAKVAKGAGGRPKGTTDDRHTIGPPNEVGELLPYTRTLSQARDGPGGIFGEKQWWQDLAWAVRNPETKIGRELMENGKVTDEQMANAIARDERYQRMDALYEEMRVRREAALRDQLLAEAQPEEAKEILRAKDLKNIFGGDESDYALADKKAAPGEEQPVRDMLASKVVHGAAEILAQLQKIAKAPELKALITELQRLGLNTSVSFADRSLGEKNVGKYNEIADHVLIGRGGATIETVLHELVHAATLRKMGDAEALLLSVERGDIKESRLAASQRSSVEALRALLNVYLDASSKPGANDLYGFHNPREFVAEALSSKAFQDFLRGPQSLWQRFVAVVKQLLGFKSNTTLLDRALSVSKEFFGEAGNRPLPADKDVPSLQRFVEGPGSAAKQTSDILERVTKLADAPLSIKQGFTRAHLAFATLNHIRQVFKDVLPGAYHGALDAYGRAKDIAKAMVENRNRDALEVSRVMSVLGEKEKGLDAKLYRLMGEATRHGILPDRPLAEQPWKHTAEKIRKYNELAAIYRSNADLAKAYDAAAAYNKADYDRIYATVARNIGRYSAMPRDLWSKIDVIKGRSAEVQALETWLLTHGSSDQRDAMRGALAQYREKQQGPYFHLGRSGDYFARFTVADTPQARAAYEKAFGVSSLTGDRVITAEDRHVFARFESVGEWQNVAQKLNELHTAGHIEPEMQTGLTEKMLGGFDSASPSFVRNMLANIEADARMDPDEKRQAQDTLRRLAIEMLPESSASKAFAQRKGVAGYDVDMNRNFVKRAQATAYFVAHNSTRPEVEDSLLAMKEGVRSLQDATSPSYDNNRGLVAAALQNEIKQRQANDMMPVATPTLDVVSALSHSFYLAANPAFFMMKTLQPWQLALPQLGARHGFVASFKAMTGATAKALGIIKDTIGDGWVRDKWHGILDPNIVVENSRANAQEKGFLKSLIAAGGVTFTQAHDMGRIAAGDNQGVSTAVKAANASLHYSEALDRMTAGLAAFNLELKRTGDTEKATEYGIQMVKNTLYDYNTHNKGRMFTKQGMFGSATPLLTQFAQYQIQTIELLSRLSMDAFGKLRSDMTPEERTAAIEQKGEARKALAGIMATTMVLAGSMGLPAVSVIAAAYNGIFSTKDDPADALGDYRNFLADTFGKDAAEIIAHGGIRALGSDLGASHLGFENLVPFSGFLADRRKLQDRFDQGALAMMGPAVGAASGFMFGAQQMMQGRYMKGLEAMLPSGLKGIAKAADLEENGMTDITGNKLPVDINSWDVFTQAFNATPAKVAEQKEAQRGANTTNMLLKQRSMDLKENFAVAAERGDGAAMQALQSQIASFNNQNPDFAITDLGSIMRMRAINRAMAGETNVTTRAKELPRMQADQRFANIQTRGMP